MTAGSRDADATDAAVAAKATAVVCHNDMLAIGVLRRLGQRRVRVPEDVSVLGFDNMFGSEICSPGLTTLAERTEDAGARAVEVLARVAYERMQEPPTQLLPTHLVVRGSTGPAA